MSDFFDLSHVMDVGVQGSAGPSVSYSEMVQQSVRQQFRVDSARAWDEELRNRWMESLRAAQIPNSEAADPFEPRAYRVFAQHVTGQPLETFDPNRTLFGDYDPLDRIRGMIDANERIRALNNPDIRTFEQIIEEVSAMQQGVEEETASMHERAPTGAFFAELLGGVIGSFTSRDPLNIITAPIGAGRTIAMRIATDMGVAAGVVTATEFMNVAPARAAAGLPERDPLFNIGVAALGAGIIRGGIEGIGYGVRRLRGSPVEDIDFNLRDSQLQQMFEVNADRPTARAGAQALDDMIFIERNNPYGEGRAAQERFIAELQDVQRVIDGEPMTAIARFLPPMPFEYIQKAADFEIVREQAPLVYARMEAAQARVDELNTQVEQRAVLRDLEVQTEVGSSVGKLSEFSRDGNERFLQYDTPEGGPTTIHVILSEDGKAEISIDPFSTKPNRFGPAIIRDAARQLQELYPEIKTLYGVRESGAGPGRTQTVDLSSLLVRRTSDKSFAETAELMSRYEVEALPNESRPDFVIRMTREEVNLGPEVEVLPPVAPLRDQLRAVNQEYEKAYSAVEAEATRMREEQARIEAKQQQQAANIFAVGLEGRTFIGPLLKHDYVEGLVERINAFNDTLDETAVAAFVREAEGEGGDVLKGESGEPLTFYHGTSREFADESDLPGQEGKWTFFATSPEHAGKFAKSTLPSRIYPVKIRAKNVGDFRDPAQVAAVKQLIIEKFPQKQGREAPKEWLDAVERGEWGVWEREWIADHFGWDAVWIAERDIHGTGKDELNLAVRSPDQIISAVGWQTADGRIDIGLTEPVDPDFHFITEDGDMTIVQAMRDLQNDADLDDAMRICLR